MHHRLLKPSLFLSFSNKTLSFSFGLPLPLTETPDSPRIVLVRPGIFDPNIFTIQDAMRVTTMMLDYMLNEDDNFVIAGQIGILDLTGVTIQHFLQFNPTFIKKMTVLTQDAAPGRQKGLHWINTPRGFEQCFNLFTNFMNEKNRSRVSFGQYENSESCLKAFKMIKTFKVTEPIPIYSSLSFSSYQSLSFCHFSSSFITTLSHCTNTFQSDCFRKSTAVKLDQWRVSSTSGRRRSCHTELTTKKKTRLMVSMRSFELAKRKAQTQYLEWMEHSGN